MRIKFLVLLTLLSQLSYGQKVDDKSIYNDILRYWTVKTVTYLPASGLSASDVKKMMKQSILLKRDKAVVFSDSCVSPMYSITKENTKAYLARIKASSKDVKITTDSFYEIEVSSPDNVSFDYIFLYDGKVLILFLDGVVFYLQLHPL